MTAVVQLQVVVSVEVLGVKMIWNPSLGYSEIGDSQLGQIPLCMKLRNLRYCEFVIKHSVKIGNEKCYCLP
jgi:hypothetical protein